MKKSGGKVPFDQNRFCSFLQCYTVLQTQSPFWCYSGDQSQSRRSVWGPARGLADRGGLNCQRPPTHGPLPELSQLSNMGNSTHNIKGQTLSFKCTMCSSQKQNTKPSQDAFQIPETHWAGEKKKGALFPLIFNLTLARFIIKENNLFICLPYLERQ